MALGQLYNDVVVEPAIHRCRHVVLLLYGLHEGCVLPVRRHGPPAVELYVHHEVRLAQLQHEAAVHGEERRQVRGEVLADHGRVNDKRGEVKNRKVIF
jgi:hypothetical protein